MRQRAPPAAAKKFHTSGTRRLRKSSIGDRGHRSGERRRRGNPPSVFEERRGKRSAGDRRRGRHRQGWPPRRRSRHQRACDDPSPQRRERSSSATCCASSLPRMTDGRIRMISSVRLLSVAPAPEQAADDRACGAGPGCRRDPASACSLIRPPSSTVWPSTHRDRLLTARFEIVGVRLFPTGGDGRNLLPDIERHDAVLGDARLDVQDDAGVAILDLVGDRRLRILHRRHRCG